MTDSRKQKLMKLDKEVLADSLLRLTEDLEQADDLVNKMTRDPEEHMKFFRQKINGLKRRSKFLSYRETANFSKKLSNLLEEMETSGLKPEDGLNLIASFFETDSAIVGNADDSSGDLGWIYQYHATELLHKYSAGCANKRKALELILKLYDNNDYGVRDRILDDIPKSFGEGEARHAIEFFTQKIAEATDDYGTWKYQNAIAILAEKMADARLYEKIKEEMYDELSESAYYDIAKVYLSNNDPWTALNRLKNISDKQGYLFEKKQDLLGEIYAKMGNKDKEAEVARKKFNHHPSLETLDNLIRIIGKDKRDEVIEQKMIDYIDGEEVDFFDIQFMIDVNRFEEAEICLFAKHSAGTLDGRFYELLLPFAESMEAGGRKLAASIIYRSLLNSILERGFTKGYSIAARYLKKLDLLAEEIDDWVGFRDNKNYHEWLVQTHGRKKSFWERYGKN